MSDHSDGLPAIVRVGPFDLTTEVIDSIGGAREGEQCFGMFSETGQKISLASGIVSPQLTAETMLHETLHAIFATYHMRARDDEERTVSIMTTGLAQVWRDNPDLVDWLSVRLQNKSKKNDPDHEREQAAGS